MRDELTGIVREAIQSAARDGMTLHTEGGQERLTARIVDKIMDGRTGRYRTGRRLYDRLMERLTKAWRL